MTDSRAVLALLRERFVVPVIRTASRETAARAVEWLAEEGFRTFEITMSVPDGVGLLRELSRRDDLLIGAGTVTDPGVAQACIEAGARFVVSPAVVPDVATACRAHGVPVMLGAMTPTEVLAAVAAGADVVKIFPASSAGGPSHVKALRAVFPDVPLMPTGGIEPPMIEAYRAAGAIAVGMGGKLVDEKAVARGDRESIALVARQILGTAAC